MTTGERSFSIRSCRPGSPGRESSGRDKRCASSIGKAPRPSISSATTRRPGRALQRAEYHQGGGHHLADEGPRSVFRPGAAVVHACRRHLRLARHDRRLLQRSEQSDALWRQEFVRLPRELPRGPRRARHGAARYRAEREFLHAGTGRSERGGCDRAWRFTARQLCRAAGRNGCAGGYLELPAGQQSRQ